ncbi:MAG TPA: T9SS type A sorting domain-containing protein, partial [Paludibacter sp.]
NSGSLSDWTTGGGASSSGSNPGQYTAIPINLAGTSGIPRLIPSMQGYLVKALSNSVNATLSIPYASSLLKNTDMQRVARKISNSSSSELASTIIHVTGSRYTDRVWLFTGSGCTHNFDNGWDGLKNFSSSALMPQIYASEADGNYQINAVNDINNTELGFYPGEDSIYTLTFIHENIDAVYPALYLIDKKTNAIIDITASGTEYKFLVHSSDPLVKRFKIVTSPGMTTEAETENEGLKIFSSGHSVFDHNLSSSNGVLSIYDISGHLVSNHSFDPNGITTIELKLPVGVYFIKGGVDQREVTSRLILK